MYHFRRPQHKRNPHCFKQVWVPIQRSPPAFTVSNTMVISRLVTYLLASPVLFPFGQKSLWKQSLPLRRDMTLYILPPSYPAYAGIGIWDYCLMSSIEHGDSFNLTKEGDLWSDDELNSEVNGTCVSLRNLELIGTSNQEENLITIDILPDEMHEKILSCLPLSAIIKASCVCKNWNHIINSKEFILNDAALWSEKTWYFMFTSSVKPVGYLYDSSMRKWYNHKLPFMVHPTWDVAPSRGLVCFMDHVANKEIYICNPITLDYKVIKIPTYPGLPKYSTLAFSVDQLKLKYTISIVRSTKAWNDLSLWDLSIHVYNSNDKIWLPPVRGKTKGWKPGKISVICDNILYILVLCLRRWDEIVPHRVITYNLDNTEPWIGVLDDESLISLPCALSHVRLMNVKKKLVLVGSIETPDSPWKIEGVGVWVLDGRVWTEVTRMPREYVVGLGKLGDVFASTGSGDMIYIQSYRGTALVVFDMVTREWFWSRKCRMHKNKKFPRENLSGFCFEPALLQFIK
uniref:F-box/kelch-repeat protein At3g61590-like n=1 Tax=Erigeron canadensis TaxID=72917 RepID=UPI001CB9A274|nr:F-box/kelch-repeat protein At3g61590-like [Erigeron canadensis]